MKFILSIFFLFLIPGSAVMCWNSLLLLIADQGILTPLLCGFGIGLLFYYLIINRFRWISTFEHELTHALVALCFLRKVTGFRVTAQRGGLVSHKGSFGGVFGDTLISLAPYFLPTLTVISVIIRLFLPTAYLLFADLTIGFTLSFHILSNFKELVMNWSGSSFQNVNGESMMTDIKQSGYILSFMAIIALTLYFYGLVFYILTSGGKGFLTASQITVKSSWIIYLSIYHKLMTIT